MARTHWRRARACVQGEQEVGDDRLAGLGLHCALAAQSNSKLFPFSFSFSVFFFLFCFLFILATK